MANSEGVTNTEPVMLQAGITAALQATIAILALAGIDEVIVAAIQAAVGAWVIVAFLLFARSRVYTVQSVRKIAAGVDPIP